MPPVIRDPEHERHVVSIAALAGGHARIENGNVVVLPVVEALNEFSDARAWPGEVQEDRRVPLITEAAQEFADARSYLVWRAQLVLDDARDGDPEASEEYKRAMEALTHLLSAWVALMRV